VSPAPQSILRVRGVSLSLSLVLCTLYFCTLYSFRPPPHTCRPISQ
jgi:hypothetical protein